LTYWWRWIIITPKGFEVYSLHAMMRKSRLETGDREGMPEAGSIPH
jgi:hypothetical protein